MNTKLIIGIIAALAVIAAGAYLLIGRGGADKERAAEQDGQQMIGRFEALVRSGRSLECTFTHRDELNASSGTVYISGGGERIRSDVSVTESGAGPMEVHLIRDGGYNYVWGSAMPQGIMMAVQDNESLFEAGENSPIDEETTEFDCRSWRVDESRFSLPSGVEFQDMGALMNLGASAGASVGAQQCTICDMIPDSDEAAECRAALQCE